ncbi:MAG: winged helix-turn-helix transcriptional regulator [Candidatus Thorarchaeota archaeon]
MVDDLDLIDKQMLIALDKNCRLSYQALAENFGITATAVRKRFDRLVTTGVIEEFSIVLMPAMMGSEYLLALIHTNGLEDEEEFIQVIGSNLNVIQVGQLLTGVGRLYFVHCEYVGAEGLHNLGVFLRTLENVTEIELHTTLIDRGKLFEIKKMHLRVLRCLLEDARMQVSDISERTGLAARRVSRAIQELIDSDAFWFATRWNLSLGGNAEFYLKLKHSGQVGVKDKIEDWLRKEFSLEYWYSYFSAIEPTLFAKFVTDHFRDSQRISRIVKNNPHVVSVDVLLSYPVTKFPRLGRTNLEKLLTDAGV